MQRERSGKTREVAATQDDDGASLDTAIATNPEALAFSED